MIAFASLPKLPSEWQAPPSTSLSTSTENLLAKVDLPPRPTEIDDLDIQVLERQFSQVNTRDPDSPESPTIPCYSSSISDLHQTTTKVSSLCHRPSLSLDIHRLHGNLESRLQPFWSTVLASRTVRIHIFASHQEHEREAKRCCHPLASRDIQTDAYGFFSAKFTLCWEEICDHPGASHIAFGDEIEEHDMLIVTEMLPPITA